MVCTVYLHKRDSFGVCLSIGDSAGNKHHMNILDIIHEMRLQINTNTFVCNYIYADYTIYCLPIFLSKTLQ